jgi:hypothetical protein
MMRARYWLSTSDPRPILPRDSAPVGGVALAEAGSCHPRAIVRASRPAEPGDSRSAVRLSDGLNPSDGQLPHPGPVRSLATPPRLNPGAFLAVVTLATTYAATPTYATMHARIRRDRGPASARACWRCGRRARVWSCVAPHGDRIRGVSGSDAPAWYSLNPDDYRPACSRCAALDDREHADARRAVAHLALSPIPRRERSTAPPAPTSPPEPEALFASDPTDPTRWSL